MVTAYAPPLPAVLTDVAANAPKADQIADLVDLIMQANTCASCGTFGMTTECPDCITGERRCSGCAFDHFLRHHNTGWIDRITKQVNRTPAGIIRSVTGVNTLWPSAGDPEPYSGLNTGFQRWLKAVARHHNLPSLPGVTVSFQRPSDANRLEEMIEYAAVFGEETDMQPVLTYRTESGMAVCYVHTAVAALLPQICLNQNVPTGKLFKRLRNLFGPSTHGWAVYQPTPRVPQAKLPKFQLHPPGLNPLNCRVITTRHDGGDGQGTVRWSKYQELCLLNPDEYPGARDHSYVVASTPDGNGGFHHFKVGMYPIPDAKFDNLYGADTDLVVDRLSYNDHIGAAGMEIVRWDFRSKTNQAVPLFEALMHGMQVSSALNISEVTSVGSQIVADA